MAEKYVAKKIPTDSKVTDMVLEEVKYSIYDKNETAIREDTHKKKNDF